VKASLVAKFSASLERQLQIQVFVVFAEWQRAAAQFSLAAAGMAW